MSGDQPLPYICSLSGISNMLQKENERYHPIANDDRLISEHRDLDLVWLKKYLVLANMAAVTNFNKICFRPWLFGFCATVYRKCVDVETYRWG